MNTSKLSRRILTLTAVFAAAASVTIGCAGETEEAPAASSASSASSGGSRRACENVKSLAQVCYDSADPGVSCPALGTAMRTEAAKKGLDEGLQDDLGSLCQNACAQRKTGHAWSEISQRLDCSSRY